MILGKSFTLWEPLYNEVNNSRPLLLKGELQSSNEGKNQVRGGEQLKIERKSDKNEALPKASQTEGAGHGAMLESGHKFY